MIHIIKNNNPKYLFNQTQKKLMDLKKTLHTKIQKTIPKKIPHISGKVDQIKNIKKTYELIQELSTVNGFNPDKKLLHRTMFNSETLPPLGKEYWWFIFIGEDTDKPIQIMFLIFKKHGTRMLFNNKNMDFKDISNNKFQGVTSCWVWDGKKMHDLGDTNSTTTVDSKTNTLTTQISNHDVEFNGTYPNFKLKIGNAVNLEMTELNQIDSKDAYATFLPPFGIGWIDIFSKANGTVLGKKFKGRAHLQKVVGVTTSGCWNWGEIFFKNGSSITFFSIGIKKNSKISIHTSTMFYDHQTKTVTKFNNPKITISKQELKNKKENIQWTIHGSDKNNKFTLVLNTYGKKEFNMKTIEWQTYLEYLVNVNEFKITTTNKKINLNELGKGTGTFEDAYGFIF
ncbi:MAG: hypothetical protein KAS30_01320 [Candidatus Diapherotrites archaeon]|nr:hypothetical protein [Candidatus Diapherotrites archaeon]